MRGVANLRRRFIRRVGAVVTATVAAAIATLGMSGVAQAAPIVTPFVSCYWQNADGSVTVAVGYTNSGTSTVTYPIGTLNYVTPNPQDQGQPTVFAPGTHNNVWAPTMSQTELSENPNWILNGYNTSENVGSLPACPTKPVPISGGAGGVVAFAALAVIIGALGFSKSTRRRRGRFNPDELLRTPVK